MEQALRAYAASNWRNERHLAILSDAVSDRHRALHRVLQANNGRSLSWRRIAEILAPSRNAGGLENGDGDTQTARTGPDRSAPDVQGGARPAAAARKAPPETDQRRQRAKNRLLGADRPVRRSSARKSCVPAAASMRLTLETTWSRQILRSGKYYDRCSSRQRPSSTRSAAICRLPRRRNSDRTTLQRSRLPCRQWRSSLRRSTLSALCEPTCASAATRHPRQSCPAACPGQRPRWVRLPRSGRGGSSPRSRRRGPGAGIHARCIASRSRQSCRPQSRSPHGSGALLFAGVRRARARAAWRR
jgi:hypothetical protein